MWLFVALVGFAVGAIVNVMDKYVLEKTVSKPVVFVFYSTAPAVFILLLSPWAGSLRSAFDFLVAALAGFSFVFGLWACYKAIQKSEVSHVNPLIGAVIPVFVFVWSLIFFNETLSLRQIAAILFLIIGSFLISMEKSGEHRGFQAGLAWGLLGGFAMSIFVTASKYLYGNNSFFSGFVWIQGAVGLIALTLLFSSVLRRTFEKKTETEKLGVKKISFIVLDKFLGVVTLVLVQYAVALGSATLVYAMAGVQYALLIIFVVLLSKLWPKFYREDYSRSELFQEAVAVLLIAGGIALLV